MIRNISDMEARSWGSDAMNQLESMVDNVGLPNVIYALAHICREKAEDLRSSWERQPSARMWEKNAAALDQLPRKFGA